MLKTPFRYLKDFIDFLRKIQLNHLVLLILLTVASIFVSVRTTTKFLYPSPFEKSTTRVNGFLTYIKSIDGQGGFMITNDTVRIKTTDNSFAKMFVFSSVGDFKWNFSAFPLMAFGQSYPVAFSIEWGQTNISVWAENGKNWYYSSNINMTLAHNRISFGGPVTIGSQYKIEINWNRNKQAQNIVAEILLENQTWHKKLTFIIPDTSLPPTLTLQAWADDYSYAMVDYNQSVFLSYDLRYTQETIFATTVSIIISVILIFVTTLALAYRSREFFPFLESLLKKTLLKIYGVLKYTTSFISSYSKTNRGFIYLISFFAIIRLGLAIFTPGHSFDILAFKAWCEVISAKGVLAIYPLSAIMPPVIIRPVYPYPPIIAYIFSLIVKAFSFATLTERTLTFLLKLPPILADLALGWITFTAIKRWRGYKAGLIAATLSLANIIPSSIWGQYDSYVALFMVMAALFVVEKKQIELGWLFAALAISTKETALPFVPGLFIASIKQRGWFSTLLGIGVFSFTIIGVWAPFLLNGYSLDFVLWQSGLGLISSTGAFSPASSEMTATTVSALNIWLLISSLKDGVSPKMAFMGAVNDNQPNQFFFLSYFHLGIILFLIFYVIVLYGFRKASSVQSLMLRFSLLMLVFYMFPTRIHERYLYFALPFLLLAYKETRFATVSYLLLLTTLSINLLSALSLQWVPPYIVNFFRFLPYAGDGSLLLLVLINISVTVLMIYRSVRG